MFLAVKVGDPVTRPTPAPSSQRTSRPSATVNTQRVNAPQTTIVVLPAHINSRPSADPTRPRLGNASNPPAVRPPPAPIASRPTNVRTNPTINQQQVISPGQANPLIIVGIVVYLALFLDNALLTIVVPIVPDFLMRIDSPISTLSNESLVAFENELNQENQRVGMLLSSKALVQLIANPIVGTFAKACGFNLLMFWGCVNLLASTLLFGYGQTYWVLLSARSLQGIASSCIGVSSMCLVAQSCTTENSRSKSMGIVLGSVALGVLLGYPFGGLLYEFLGKAAPFYSVAFLVLLTLGLQLVFTSFKYQRSADTSSSMQWKTFLGDKRIMITAGSICISTTAMAVLEPCLPLWLMKTIKPEKWQLGIVFIPDSVGYFIGTNFFGSYALKYGRHKAALAAMIFIGIACFVIPHATSILSLTIPHLCLGLGIGIVDSSLVPLLATIVDRNYSTTDYAVVYSMQQSAVSLAYALGPLVGGSLARLVGFPAVMAMVGFINVLYSPMLMELSSYGQDLYTRYEQATL